MRRTVQHPHACRAPRPRPVARRRVAILVALVALGGLATLGVPGGQATHLAAPEVWDVMVIRVHFDDYDAESRYDKAEVEGFYDRLDSIFQNTSYGDVGWSATVTDLYQMPKVRSQYVDDFADGDLSNDGKFGRVLRDAIDQLSAAEKAILVDSDAVNVVMAETDPTEFHRGQAATCNFSVEVGGDTEDITIGCAIFSENPSEDDVHVWGRWAHELAHVIQQGGPAHPSDYNNEFELLDSNYPGHVSAFEKHDDQWLGDWLPDDRIVDVVKDEGGRHCLRAIELDPAGVPNPVILKVPLTEISYYLVSMHLLRTGDHLNPIPDEGILIERVVEGADQWVTVQGNPDRNTLWKKGDVFVSTDDGVTIEVDPQRGDEESWCVNVSYGQGATKPDVGMHPWRAPPGNTWETTDIWVDSPVNDYGTFRYGKWDDGTGNLVPRGNGDDPALEQVNRVYARVRNFGDQPATDVEVEFEVTDPPGLGIQGADSWKSLGSVDKADFPALASIAPGGFTDVYVEWTPEGALAPDDLEEGRFSFHTCLRVVIDPVAGEQILSNQDGEEEQENIAYFEAPAGDDGIEQTGFTLHNDDPTDPRFFHLDWKRDTPDDWSLDVNGGDFGVEVPPGDSVFIPVLIEYEGGPTPGESFQTEVRASTLELLVNDLDPDDKHPVFDPLGGVTLEARVVQPVDLDCTATSRGDAVHVTGRLRGYESFAGQEPLRVQAVARDPDTGRLQPETAQTVTVQEGGFSLTLDTQGNVEEVACLFAGTQFLASASSGYVPLDGVPGGEADLKVEVTTDPAENVTADSVLTYGLTVTNGGPDAAEDVVVTDALPSGVSFIAAAASQGSCSGTAIVVCTLGDLGPGAVATIQIDVNVTAEGLLTNQAEATSSTPDPAPANNMVTTETTAGPSEDIPGPALALVVMAVAVAVAGWRRRR